MYSDYIETLSENQGFLLNKIFDVSKRLGGNKVAANVSQEIRSAYACFNSESGRNLEQYLNLIVNLSKPQKREQYKFYLNCKDEILSGKSIEDVMSGEEFSYVKSENSHEQFWRVITNSLSEFDNNIGSKLIAYLIQNVINHSLFSNSKVGLGFRDDLDLLLVMLLDQVGWGDKWGKHRNNTDENVAEIAEWILGEERHKGQGILDIISEEKRGVLGLYDTLAFRLFCSADRGGNIFNLQRALAKHGNPEAPTQGSVNKIAIEEMREISQKVFQTFNEQYIKKKKNIFKEIDNLTLGDLASQYAEYVRQKISTGEIDNVDNDIKILKSGIKSFIIFQLGNEFVSSGVGCGYYDTKGMEDKREIRKKVNNYLFEECFNPSINTENYEYFIDYLLSSFASVFASEHGRDFIPHINEFTKVLYPKKLVQYWKENRNAIKMLNLTTEDKTVMTSNYKAVYKEDLPGVFDILDKLVQEQEEKIIQIGKLISLLKVLGNHS